MGTQKVREVGVYSAQTTPKSAKIRQAVVYAAVRVPSSVQVRSLSALVLAADNRPIPVRLVDANVVEQVRSRDFSINPLTAVFAAIAWEWKLTLDPTKFTLVARTRTNDPYFDAEVVITALPGSGYTKSTALRYRRYPFSEAFKGKDLTALKVTSATTVHALLAQINGLYGLALTTVDVVDHAVAANQLVQLQTTATSFYFRPGESVTLGGVTALATAVAVGDLTGFDPS